MEKINKILKDEFGRISGIFLINKPSGITSHDLIKEVRQLLKTREVGHAGTLDPFASGLMIVLVGKKTKLSNTFLEGNKTYITEILLGVGTITQDIEGKVFDIKSIQNFSLKKLKSVLSSFKPNYIQSVPVFSSVKVGGNKLRELARKSEKFEIIKKDGKEYVEFHSKNFTKILELPKRKVSIEKIEILEQVVFDKLERIISNSLTLPIKKKYLNDFSKKIPENINCAKITLEIECSKGTYIRSLAKDIGDKLGLPALVLTLKRTKLGEFTEKDLIILDNGLISADL